MIEVYGVEWLADGGAHEGPHLQNGDERRAWTGEIANFLLGLPRPAVLHAFDSDGVAAAHIDTEKDSRAPRDHSRFGLQEVGFVVEGLERATEQVGQVSRLGKSGWESDGGGDLPRFRRGRQSM